MESDIQNSFINALSEIQEQLENLETEYSRLGGEEFNLDPSNFNEGTKAELKALLSEASRDYTRMYNTLEESKHLYESSLDLLNTELIDGRIVSDIFEELESNCQTADSLVSEYITGSEKLIDTSTKMSEVVERDMDEIFQDDPAGTKDIYKDIVKRYRGEA